MTNILRRPVLGVCLSVLLLAVSFVAQISLADTTWTGAVNQDWSNAGNWNNGAPGANNNDAYVITSTGNYPIFSSGTSTSSRDIRVGTGTAGRLDQTGGTLNTADNAWFWLGYQGVTATYNLANTATTGGTFTGFGQGTGSINIGGSLKNGYLLVGLDTGTTSTVNLNTTGTLSAGFISIGGNGAPTATFNIDNGTVNVANEIEVGATLPFAQGSGVNAFNMSGGTVTANIFAVGRAQDASGTMTSTATITGGTLNVKQFFQMGLHGSVSNLATVNHTGGTINVNTLGGGVLDMGVFEQSTNVFNQESGTLNLDNGASIAYGTGGNHSGTSTFNQDGGTVTFFSDTGTTVGGGGSVNLGVGNSTGTYTYNLNGGTLTTPAVTKTSIGASGTFNFNGGTLKAAASNASFMQGLTAANVGDGGAKIDSNGFNVQINQQLLGTGVGGLTKTSAGVLTLSANNTYVGATTINGGSLVLSGSGAVNSSSGIAVNGTGAQFVSSSFTAVSPIVALTNGTVDGTGTINTVNVANSATNTIANGAGTSGLLTIGALNFSGAGNFSLNVATTSPVVATTTISTNAAGLVTVNATNASWAPGVYDLISYGSLTGAGFGRFQKGTIGGLSGRQSATLSNPAGFIALTITGDNPKWTGALSSTWSTAVMTNPKNWQLVTAGTPTDFIAGDVVLLDDSASNFTVNISAANVTPTSTTFNANNNYTVNGPFGIAGTGTLTKSGGGALTLNGASTYSGGTLLNGGTLNINNASAIGTGLLTASSATIDNTSGAAVTLSTNNAQKWNGDVTFGGTNALNMGTGTITLAADSTVTTNGAANITLGGAISGAGSITKAGTNTLTLSGNNNFTGALTVNSGAVVLSGNNSYAGVTTLNGGVLTVSGSLNNGHSFDLEDNVGSTLNVNGTVNVRSFDALGATVNLNAGGSITPSAGQLRDGGIANFNGGSFSSTGEYWIGGDSGTGTVFQTGGTVSSQSWFVIGRAAMGIYNISAGSLNGATLGNNFTLASFFGSSGTLNISGTASVSSGNEFWDGESGTGAVTQTGGSMSSRSWFVIGRNSGASGTYTISGGTLTGASVAGAGNITIGSFAGATGELDVSGTAAVSTPNSLFVGEGGIGTLNLSGGSITANTVTVGVNGGANGTLNLDGGTLQTGSLGQGGGVGTINFNGGTLKASASSTTFLTGLSAYVRNGGAVIDSNGKDIHITPSLQHSNFGDDNAIDGGLTKLGNGTLTLDANSFYTGPTTVSGGTLALGTGNAISNTSQVILAGGSLTTGSFSQDFTGSAAPATLKVTANSTLDFGTSGNQQTVKFASSNGTSVPTAAWTNGAILRVSNWSGTPVVGSSSDLDQLIIGTDATGLNTSQLTHLHFTGYLTGASILGTGSANPGEVVPSSTVRLILGDVNNNLLADGGDILPFEQALTDLAGYQTSHSYDLLDMQDIFDINHDTVITNADLQAFLHYLITGSASGAPVPEPASSVLLGIGSAVLAGFCLRRGANGKKMHESICFGSN